MILNKFKNIFLQHKKKIVGVFVLVVIILFFLFRNGSNNNILIINPTFGTFVKSIKATGEVVSNTDLNLSFNKQDIVKSVNVSVGDKVRKGQILASLNTNSEYADIVQAQGSLKLAEAKLKKILDGISNEEINLSRVSLDNARQDYENSKKNQDILVANAYKKLLNSTIEAYSTNSGLSVILPTITGTYKLNKEGAINLSVYPISSNNFYFSASGIVSGTGAVNTTSNEPLLDTGLFIKFPSFQNLSTMNLTIDIPNKKAGDYLANLNAYELALSNRDSVLSSALSLISKAEAELALKQAKVRDADVALGEAEVFGAEGALRRAQVFYENKILRAPTDGTVTKVNIKYGELVEANKEAIVLQDIDSLYVEALINESNIVSLKIGQLVKIYFDALKEKEFTGIVSHIDPSSLSTDGVVNYKIKVLINEKDIQIRPGMNAEIDIEIFKKENTLSIPEAVSKEGEDGKYFVNILLDEKKNKTEKREIQKGEKGDGNMIEVISGISKGDKLIQEKK